MALVVRISYQSNLRQVYDGLDVLRPQLQRATLQALNRTATTVRKEGSNALSDVVQPRRKTDVKKAFDLDRATRVSRQAIITIDEKHLPLDKVKGVRVASYMKGRRRVQRVTYRGKIIKGAFRPKNLVSGDKAIFTQKRGKYKTGNRKVRRLYAFSLLQEAERNKLLKRMSRVADRRFIIELERALTFQLSKG